MAQQSGPLGADVAVTHILVVADPAVSRRFWTDVLGAELYREYGGASVVLKFAGTWLLLVSGGGPTADKPGVTFGPPADPDQVSHAMTLRVTDCRAAYAALTARVRPSSPRRIIGAGKSAASSEIPTATSWRSASQYLPNRGRSGRARRRCR
jgi:catechol 2,3-dioxygenase-like lactoylglutathione lyase family enzyme